MIETQIAQIAAAILVNHSREIPGEPKNSPEFIHVVAEQKRRRSLANGL